MTNGTAGEAPRREILPLIDAVDIDLKDFTDARYLSRFFPRYRMTGRPPTEVDTACRLAEVARETLEHVYTGNC